MNLITILWMLLMLLGFDAGAQGTEDMVEVGTNAFDMVIGSVMAVCVCIVTCVFIKNA